MNNRPPKPHRLPRLRRCMKRVVIPVQPIQQRRLPRRLYLMHNIRLLPFRRRIIHRSRTFGPTPIALADEKCAADRSRVGLAAALGEDGFGFDDAAGCAFVVDAEDAGVEDEGAVCGGGGEGAKEGDGALAVDDAGGVEFWDAWDWDGGVEGVEVGYFLVGVFECW